LTIDDQNLGTPQQGYLQCKMNGQLIEAVYPGIAILCVPGNKEVTVWGKTSEGMISIIIDQVEATGTFALKGTSNNGAGIMIKSAMYEVKKSNTPFTVTIEKIEELNLSNASGAKAIRGSFEGKLMGDDGSLVEITDGKFSTQ
jgi:hypothetical protein